uniref:Putative secreted protein n=1 Tax=Ixodes ricinus TaxID=34613 RepID=A0A6B0UHJ8_IXORI
MTFLRFRLVFFFFHFLTSLCLVSHRLSKCLSMLGDSSVLVGVAVCFLMLSVMSLTHTLRLSGGSFFSKSLRTFSHLVMVALGRFCLDLSDFWRLVVGWATSIWRM